MTRVWQALTKGRIDSTRYSGHSFHSGAATTAAWMGIEDSTIKMLGRWKSSALPPLHENSKGSVGISLKPPGGENEAADIQTVKSQPQHYAPGIIVRSAGLCLKKIKKRW